MKSVRDLADDIRRILLASDEPPDVANIAAAYRAVAGVGTPARSLSQLRLVEAEIVGAGPLQALLDDETVSDVLVHGGGQVWVERENGLARSEVQLGEGNHDGEHAARSLAVRLIGACGRRLDESQPFADGVLPSGHRVHASIPPVAVDGTCLSIRAVRPQRFDVKALRAAGMLTPAVGDWLERLVGAGVSLVVSGETGVGKTTLLSALIGALDPKLRVVVLEDTSELKPRHPQVVRLQSRPPNVEGEGAVSLQQLVRQALRMRPDRLVLGEVRGLEIVDLLVAMNTGHRGGMCTVHANDVADVPTRFEALGLLAGVPRAAVHALVSSAIQVVVHLQRVDGVRKVVEVGIIRAKPDGLVEAATALRVEGAVVIPGPGYPMLEHYVTNVRAS